MCYGETIRLHRMEMGPRAFLFPKHQLQIHSRCKLYVVCQVRSCSLKLTFRLVSVSSLSASHCRWQFSTDSRAASSAPAPSQTNFLVGLLNVPSAKWPCWSFENVRHINSKLVRLSAPCVLSSSVCKRSKTFLESDSLINITNISPRSNHLTPLMPSMIQLVFAIDHSSSCSGPWTTNNSVNLIRMPRNGCDLFQVTF